MYCNACTYCKYFKYSYTQFGTVYIYCKKEYGGRFSINFKEDAPFSCGMIKLSKQGKKRLKQLTHQHEDKGE